MSDKEWDAWQSANKNWREAWRDVALLGPDSVANSADAIGRICDEMGAKVTSLNNWRKVPLETRPASKPDFDDTTARAIDHLHQQLADEVSKFTEQARHALKFDAT
ncbi:hypothetical protein ACWGI1_04740 [Streptomyces sp. NPDC054835]